MSFFGNSRLSRYSRVANVHDVDEVDMKEAVAFAADSKSARLREHTPPSPDASYVVVSLEESGSEDERGAGREVRFSSSGHEGDRESGMARRLQRINGATALDESSLSHVLHLPKHRKSDDLRLKCRTCASDLPVRMKNASAVVYNGEIYLGGGYTGNPATDSKIYTYNSPFDLWGFVAVTAPCKWFGMAVFNEQLVLVGGKEVRRGHRVADCWNKLTVLDPDTSTWTHSLPPMQASRVAPVVFTSGSYLAVAGGRIGRLDYNVEVLDRETLQWTQPGPLPLKCNLLNSLVHEDYWYLLSQEKPYGLLCSRLADALRQDTTERGSCSPPPERSSTWFSLPKPPTQPIRIVRLADFILALSPTSANGRHLTIYAYCPNQEIWTEAGRVPAICSKATAIATPEGELVFLGGDAGNYEYSNKIHKVTIATETDIQKKAQIVVTV